MTEHISEEQIRNYQRRALLPPDIIAVHHHLEQCEACRRRLADLDTLTARAVAVRRAIQDAGDLPADHLPADQMMAYVDGQVEAVERELIETHLESCAPCRAEIDDLQVFQKEIAAEPRRYTGDAPRTSFWQTLIMAWRRPAWSAALGAATIGLLIYGLAIRPLRREINGLNMQIHALQQTHQALQEQLAQTLRPGPEPAARPTDAFPDAIRLREERSDITLDREGRLTGLGDAPSDVQQAIVTALRNERVTVSSDVKPLSSPPGVLMSSAGHETVFQPLAPVGTAVLSQRPTFRWRRYPNVVFYQVAVFDEGFGEVMTSDPLRATEWTAPRPLGRSRIYLWQVTAKLADGKEVSAPAPPAPPAKMKIVDDRTAETISQARARYGASHLVLGALYARDGLLDEAERELAALARANPESSVAAKLLA